MTKLDNKNIIYKGYDLYIERRLSNYLKEFYKKTYSKIDSYERKKRTTKNLVIFCVILVIASIYPEFVKGFKTFIMSIAENVSSNSEYIENQFDNIERNNNLWHFFMPLVIVAIIGFYIVKRPRFNVDINIIQGAFGFWGEFYSNDKNANITPNFEQLPIELPHYDNCKSLWQIFGKIPKHNIQIQQLEFYKANTTNNFKPLLISIDKKSPKHALAFICNKDCNNKTLERISTNSDIVSLFSNQHKPKANKFIKDLILTLENMHADLSNIFKNCDISPLQVRICQEHIYIVVPYYSLFFVPDYMKGAEQDIVLTQNIMRIVEIAVNL